jgi:hypothetical protein
MLAGACSQNRSACSTSSTCARSATDTARGCGRRGGRGGLGGAGERRWTRYQLKRGWPTARHALAVPTIGDSVAMTTSTAALTRWAGSGRSARWAGSWRCWPQARTAARRGPLDLQHLGLLGKLLAQPGVLGLQPGQLPLQRIGRRAATPRGLAQRGQRALVALLAPFGEQRGVQALAAQQGALPLLVELLVLTPGSAACRRPGTGVVAGAAPAPGVGHLVHGCSLRPHLGGGHRRHLSGWSSLARHSPIPLRQASHERLTQRDAACLRRSGHRIDGDGARDRCTRLLRPEPPAPAGPSSWVVITFSTSSSRPSAGRR